MSGPLRLGLLGCADIATRRVLPAVARAPGLTLAAVASRSTQRARAVADEFGGVAAASYEQLLERPDVEAVYAPVPAALHAHWVRAALRAGKHVLAEKPLTTNPEETAELVALARSADLVLRENVMFTHHPQHHRVRALLASGAIGDPRVLSASFTVPPRPAGDIRHRADLGGGALLDIGYYPLRAAQFLLGTDLTVVGATARVDPESGVDVAGGVLLRREPGVSIQLSFGMEHYYTSRYEVLGTEGRLYLEHAFTPPATHSPTVLVERTGTTDRLTLEPYDQCHGTLESFARDVRSGAGTPDDGILRQAELIADIQRAGRASSDELAHHAVGGDAP